MNPRLLAVSALSAVVLLACKGDAPPSGASSTAAAPGTPHPSGGATGAAPATGGTCSIVGDWVGTYPPGPYPFSGTELDFTFRADGTGESKSARADSKVLWRMDGAALVFHGTESGVGGRFSCRKEDEAKLNLTFGAGCSTVTLALISDPCLGRAKTENGLTFRRK